MGCFNGNTPFRFLTNMIHSQFNPEYYVNLSQFKISLIFQRLIWILLIVAPSSK
jgi:hypothetical protein